MNLFRAELERLTARRFAQLMLVLLLAAFGITIATTLAGSHAPTERELAVAQVQAEQVWEENQNAYRQCLDVRERGANAPAELREKFAFDCEQLRYERPTATDFLYGVFVFDRQITGLVYFLIAFLALFGFLVGASYLGAELNSGGMTNLLLWRPQRMVVLGTKLATLLAVVAVVTVLSGAGYLSAFWLIAKVRGLSGEPDGAFWLDLSGTLGRGLGLVLLAGALGFAIAALSRHTAAAMGALAAYTVIWEGGARIVMEIVGTSRPDQWMLSSYLGAWITGSGRYYDRHACGGRYSYVDTCDPVYTIGWPSGLVVLLVLVGAAVAAAFTVFNRRDLT